MPPVLRPRVGRGETASRALVAFWLGTFPIAGRAAELARMAEGDGWDGLAFTDSQNLGGDTFAALAIAAHVTQRITLATGATNPATRHPAVVASVVDANRADMQSRRGSKQLDHWYPV